MTEKEKKSTDLCVSQRRIRLIMKSSPNVGSIGSDALFAVAKSTELFIKYLAQEGLKRSPQPARKSRSPLLSYTGISTFVRSKESLNFLAEIIPKKMTIAECKKLMAEENKESQNNASKASGSSSEDDDESDSSSS